MVAPTTPISQLEAFAAEPIMQRRVELVEAIKTGTLTKAWADSFVSKLGDAPEIGAEWKIAQDTLAGSSTSMTLDTPEKQLVWAVAFALEQASGQPTGAVYKNFIEHSVARREKQTAARQIENSLHDSGVTVSWGAPGSWFWFDPEERHVNLDPQFSLVVGFEHARAVMAHEIGHSQLSVKFSDALLALKERADALRDKGKQTPLTPEEFATIKRSEAEFNLRAGFYNSGEDACVNRYAVLKGKDYQQDLAESINRVSFVLQGSGHHMLREAGKPILTPQKNPALEAEQQIAHLGRALNLAFFTSTGLLENTETDWKKAGVEPDAIRELTKGKKSGDGFQQLVQASVGAKGLAALQPSSFDYRLLSFMFRTRAARYADHRNKLMDELWDTHAADQAKLVLDAIEQQAQQQAQKNTKQKPDPSKSQQKGQQSGNGQGGSGGQSKPEQKQQGGGSGQGQSQPESQPQSGEGSGSSSSGQGKSGGPPRTPTSDQSKGSGGGSDPANPANQGAGGGSAQGEPKSDEGAGSGQDGGYQTGKPKSEKPQGGGEGKGEPVKVEGGQQIGLPERLPATPGEARRREQPAKGKDESRTLDAETIAELLRAIREGRLERAHASGTGQAPSPGDASGTFATISSNQGGTQRGVDLAALASGNWTQYQSRINELGPFIQRVTRKLDYVRSQQVHETRTFSERLVEIPVDGNVLGRLDRQAHINLQVKLRTGQIPEAQERARWRPDSVKSEPTTSEVMVLIDGSGSMLYDLPGGGRRIWSAVQSGAVIYEAGKRAKFDSFVGVWGDDQLRLVVKPGDSPAKAGEAFERVKNGINSGTLLSGNLQQVTEALSKHSNRNGSAYSGHTHILIISDGELNGGDDKPCIRMLEQLYKLGEYVTVDIAILGGARHTALHTVAQALSARGKKYRVNIVHGDSAEEIPILLAELLEKRFREGGGCVTHAVPDSVKRQNLARAARAMAHTP